MKQVIFSLLLFTVIVSCQKEIGFENGSGSGNGNGNGGSNPSTVKCTGCSYLPVCDSTTLTYIDSTAAGTDTTTSVLMILGDTTINGVKFTRVSSSAVFSQGLLYSCAGGDYKVYQPVPDLGINIDSLLQSFGLPAGSITIPSQIQTTILKSNATAGTTWSDVVFQATPFPLVTITGKLDYKIEAKGIQCTVLGKTYNNVIHVSSKLNVAIPLVPLPFDITIDSYFADGIGVIESRTTNNGIVESETKLLAYKIK